MNNAKATTSTVIPALRYRDAHKAIEWLERAFGMKRQAVYDGPNGTVAHAQLTFGNGMVMLGSAANADPTYKISQPDEVGGKVTSATCLIVADAAAVFAQATAAGAEVTMPLMEMDYGGKAFNVRDPEGHLWSVGEYDPWA